MMGVWGLPAERVVCICSCRDVSWGVTRSGGTRDPAARSAAGMGTRNTAREGMLPHCCQCGGPGTAP